MSDLLWTKPREVGGVLLVAPPTVRCFFRALEVFGAEIGAVREARSRIDGDINVEAALAPFLASASDDRRLAYVLEDVLKPPERGYWNDDELAAATSAVMTVLGKNLARLDSLLGVPEAEINEETIAGDDTIYVLACAERFHLDPREILDWPVGLFLDVIDAKVDATRASGRSGEGRSVEEVLSGGMFATVDAANPDDPIRG